MINHSDKDKLIIGLLRLGWHVNLKGRKKYLEFVYKERVGSLFVTNGGRLVRRRENSAHTYEEVMPGSSVHESIMKSYEAGLEYVVDFNI